MKTILVGGRQARGPTHYAHIGDLYWWLYYLNGGDFQDKAYLWESDRTEPSVIGWSLLSPQYQAFDVSAHPVHSKGEQARRMLLWTELKTRDLVGEQMGSDLCTMWVAEDDAGLITHLESQGFSRSDYHMHYMIRELRGPAPEPQLPQGYRVRHVFGMEEVDKRAAVSYAAFGSSLPLDAYTRRYLRFMRSPAYVPGRDLVSVTPDGQFVTFCIYWIDIVNQVGLFEPMGTHPDYRRRGLARAVLETGLERMKAEGMTKATVCVAFDNPAAQKLYTSMGFHIARRVWTYVKNL
jgi:ribosomal protein S18 acetylase RimI-like enzyme